MTTRADNWSVLGLDRTALVRKAVGVVVMLIGIGAGWWLTVHDGLAERPTEAESKALVERELEVHRESAEPHPPLSRVLERLTERQEQLLRDVTTQSAVLREIGKTLDELRADVRRMRRSR